jgi:hypothetical protein
MHEAIQTERLAWQHRISTLEAVCAQKDRELKALRDVADWASILKARDVGAEECDSEDEERDAAASIITARHELYAALARWEAER